MDSDYEKQEKDYYYDSDVIVNISDYDGDGNAEYDSDDESLAVGIKRLPYSVLSEKDIEKRQESAIASVSSILSIPKSEASILLRNCEWRFSRVNDEWFADEAGLRERVGLLINCNAVNLSSPKIPKKARKLKKQKTQHKKQTCGICFDEVGDEDEMMASDFCDHYFCKICWEGYATAAIADGPKCLSLRCPAPKCRAAIRVEDAIFPLISEEAIAKYKKFLMRSYVEGNRKIKWCPAPGCEFAIECETMGSAQDVVCRCGYGFCWNCCEEHHRPVECATVAKWIEKCTSESENTTWILANTKPCPMCKRNIEKNQGCMHMTCTPPCKYEFCWLCLGDWHKHVRESDYSCNRYRAAEKRGNPSEAETIRLRAKQSLIKYTHYYERWASNQKSMEKALKDLNDLKTTGTLDRMSDYFSMSTFQLKFINDAWLQIVECRRVLKWTYAYGYYFPDQDLAKKNFFEYLQGQAEGALEKLHKCAEKDMKPFTDKLEVQDKKDLENSFTEYRIRLTDLTTITRNFFANLVQALENNLEDVKSDSCISGMC